MWDRAGRLVERRRDTLALSYGYDEDGRRAFVAYPDGSRTDYSYDQAWPARRACDIRRPARSTFERDAAGRLVGASGAGLNARWNYELG